jgi:cell division protein FtsI (penicillin-binding protein 3)
MKTKLKRIFNGTRLMFVLFTVFLAYCLFCTVRMQYFDDELRERQRLAKLRLSDSTSSAFRGDILSSNRQTLATYMPEFALWVDFKIGRFKRRTIDPERVVADRNSPDYATLDTLSIAIYRSFARALSRFVGGGSADTYYRMLYESRLKAEKSDKFRHRKIPSHNISIFQRDSIFNAPYLNSPRQRYLSGIASEAVDKRMHPFGALAHSAIGDLRNRWGVESTHNRILDNGDNVITTLDTRMQDICETVLRQQLVAEQGRFSGGTVVLMETSTGDIKAMANLGSYDERYTSSRIEDTYNNAVRATIEPGSTFKVASLMAALETGKVKITDRIDCDADCDTAGRKKTWNGVIEVSNRRYGALTVSQIIEQSINIGTAKMVHKAFGNDGGKFVEALRKLGVVSPVGGLSEVEPFINTPDNKKLWNRRTSMYVISYGYQVKMAPVHILSFYNAIANYGYMVKPRLVKAIRYASGKEETLKPDVASNPMCSEATLKAVQEVLSNVVAYGSARQIAGSRYGISGKTGTSNIFIEKAGGYTTADGKGRLQASFCGYFPEKRPQYTCIVVLYSRYLSSSERAEIYASRYAVPTFREISDRIMLLNPDNCKPYTSDDTLILSPLRNSSGKNLTTLAAELDLPLVAADGWNKVEIDSVGNSYRLTKINIDRRQIPDVTGMGLRDAVNLLESLGLKVRVKGVGSVVKQTPVCGVALKKGQTVEIQLRQ